MNQAEFYQLPSLKGEDVNMPIQNSIIRTRKVQRLKSTMYIQSLPSSFFFDGDLITVQFTVGP